MTQNEDSTKTFSLLCNIRNFYINKKKEKNYKMSKKRRRKKTAKQITRNEIVNLRISSAEDQFFHFISVCFGL